MEEKRLTYKEVSGMIDEWLPTTTGMTFSTEEVWRRFNVFSVTEKQRVSQKLYNLKLAGTLELKAGRYRYIDASCPVIEWRVADVSNIIPWRWPFGLENLVKLYPRNICVVAGEKDACKTALALNSIRLNLGDFDIAYFSSEMGPEELKQRLLEFNDVTEEAWHRRVEWLEWRGCNYDIRPNKINIIDYLEVEDFTVVHLVIREIWQYLKTGIAIIMIQMARGAEFGRGRDLSLEKARLYLTLSIEGKERKLKIKVAKNRADKMINPVGKIWNFKRKGAYLIEPEEI